MNTKQTKKKEIVIKYEKNKSSSRANIRLWFCYGLDVDDPKVPYAKLGHQPVVLAIGK